MPWRIKFFRASKVIAQRLIQGQQLEKLPSPIKNEIYSGIKHSKFNKTVKTDKVSIIGKCRTDGEGAKISILDGRRLCMAPRALF